MAVSNYSQCLFITVPELGINCHQQAMWNIITTYSDYNQETFHPRCNEHLAPTIAKLIDRRVKGEDGSGDYIRRIEPR